MVHEVGEVEVARGRVAADKVGETVAAERFVHRPQPVRPLGVPRRGHVALEIALADEKGGHRLGKRRLVKLS
jgi:hypothetical protein